MTTQVQTRTVDYDCIEAALNRLELNFIRVRKNGAVVFSSNGFWSRKRTYGLKRYIKQLCDENVPLRHTR